MLRLKTNLTPEKVQRIVPQEGCSVVSDACLDSPPPRPRSVSPLFDEATEKELNEMVNEANVAMFDDDEEEEFELEENTVDKYFEELEASMPSELRAKLMGPDGKPCWERYVNLELDDIQKEPGYDMTVRDRHIEREKNMQRMIDSVMQSTTDWMKWETQYGLGVSEGVEGDCAIPKIREDVREKVERCLTLKGDALTAYLERERVYRGHGIALDYAKDFAQWRDFLSNETNREMFCENLAVRTHHMQMRFQYEHLLEGYQNLSKVVVPSLLHLINWQERAAGNEDWKEIENGTLVFLATLLEKERDTSKYNRRMFELLSSKLDQQELTILKLERRLTTNPESYIQPSPSFLPLIERCLRCHIVQMRHDVDGLTKFATKNLPSTPTTVPRAPSPDRPYTPSSPVYQPPGTPERPYSPTSPIHGPSTSTYNPVNPEARDSPVSPASSDLMSVWDDPPGCYEDGLEGIVELEQTPPPSKRAKRPPPSPIRRSKRLRRFRQLFSPDAYTTA